MRGNDGMFFWGTCRHTLGVPATLYDLETWNGILIHLNYCSDKKVSFYWSYMTLNGTYSRSSLARTDTQALSMHMRVLYATSSIKYLDEIALISYWIPRACTGLGTSIWPLRCICCRRDSGKLSSPTDLRQDLSISHTWTLGQVQFQTKHDRPCSAALAEDERIPPESPIPWPFSLPRCGIWASSILYPRVPAH